MNRINFRLARGEEELYEILALRYRIFALEKGWIATNPSGIDFDQWDFASSHLCAVDESGKVLGTMRLIHNSPFGFPGEAACPCLIGSSKDRTYEVSRLAVEEQERGRRSLILIGLCRLVPRLAKLHKIDDWIVVVDKPVARILKGLGFNFDFTGEVVDHLGSPCVPLRCTMTEARRVLYQPNLSELLATHIEEAYETIE